MCNWDESEHPRGQPENAGQFVEKFPDGFGGEHQPSAAEKERLRQIGVGTGRTLRAEKVVFLPKQEYAELCSAVWTKYADKIPRIGRLLYGQYYYQFRYAQSQERIVCTGRLRIEGNEDYISEVMREDENK